MSQLDIIEAVRALEARLKLWGVEVDVHKRAEGFIDDLVARGWVMSATRETRPAPPKRADQCPRCGGIVGACHCTREQLAADYDDTPPTTRARPTPAPTEFQAARAALRREAEEAGDE